MFSTHRVHHNHCCDESQPLLRWMLLSHFTDRNTEAWTNWIICLRAHSQSGLHLAWCLHKSKHTASIDGLGQPQDRDMKMRCPSLPLGFQGTKDRVPGPHSSLPPPEAMASHHWDALAGELDLIYMSQPGMSDWRLCTGGGGGRITE